MDPYALPKKLPFSSRALPKKVVISYIIDYLIIIVLIAAFYFLDAIEPFHQRFAIQNYSLHYPYAEKERVPVPLLLVLVIAVPALVIAFYTLVIDGLFSHHKPGGRWSWAGQYRAKDRLWELNCGVLGLLLASGTAFVITAALKNAAGKPRPDFIDRCDPRPGTQVPTDFTLFDDSICTWTDDHKRKDGYRSWPSGHSSSSWGGLFYLSLYLAGKLHIFDNRGEVWKTFVVLVPTLGAALITVTRIQDARHHPFDVITGSLLGVACAWVSYRQYFPSLAESWRKGRAYPIRSWGTAPAGPTDVVAEREIARDQGVEPFRAPSARFPAQEYEASDAGGGSEPTREANVFRAQVSATERLRQQEFPGAPRKDGPVAYPGATGYVGARGRGSDAGWDNSSDENGQTSYELQPQYRPPPRITTPDILGPSEANSRASSRPPKGGEASPPGRDVIAEAR